MDHMADICAKCFGPPVVGVQPDEPNYIVCMDGNFQHRRHLAASVENPDHLKTPSCFIKPQKVLEMQLSMGPNYIDETAVSDCETKKKRRIIFNQIIFQDPCSQQHTAANDTRDVSTWRQCNETGLFGMACWHDQIIRLINIVQSGEKCVSELFHHNSQNMSLIINVI
jgi:hypothetical protein